MSRIKENWILIFVLLFFLLILCFIINLSLGSVHIPFNEIIKIIFGVQGDNLIWENIIWYFRLPKSITAVIVGAGLSVSGLQMQTLFKNPLAGPFVLGISSGASLGVALLVMTGLNLNLFGVDVSFLEQWWVVLAATLGAAIVLIMVMLVSLRVKDSMSLLIIGLMFGSATGALVSILQFFSEAQQIQAYLIWTFGSLGGLDWNSLSLFIPVIIIGLGISLVLIKQMNALLLGENYAQSMGLNMQSVRIWIIISTSLLAGSITAFCGPIAFIGIAVPHLARMLFFSADHRILFPAVVISGALLMLVCDTIAQLPGSEYTLPINAITSLFGAPVVIWIIISRKNLRTSFG